MSEHRIPATMRYQVIVADPPWEYRNKKTGGTMKSGSVAKYPTMSLDEICGLNVPEISEKNAVLFLWGTTPLADYPFEVMESWGFKYKTKIYWIKTGRLGLGYWFRGRVEECLVGIKGKVPAFRCQRPNAIQSKARKHSQKPEEFFQLIEPELTRCNLNSRIELFARESRNGWVSWGNEIIDTITQSAAGEQASKGSSRKE
ncbi:MAG: MT-A70 family methyltransferase [Methanoregula sp.]|jgi:N6-adenosine-specific RNA methylase IME4|nr:MT-A70 family methyltransferase [Methanoregula sp.]